MRITKKNIKDVFKAKESSVESMELKGFELIEELFVDSSGFGSENEPALTPNSFLGKVEELLSEHGTLTAKITSVGQFQVFCGLFKKTGKSISKKVGNNTYKINYKDKEAIRLHDTDILIFEGDHVTLDSGGYETRTTKDRMNKFLPYGVTVFQKKGEWFISDVRDKTTKEFFDGIKIPA